jgi:ribosomal RNA methyltransferase Nop2
VYCYSQYFLNFTLFLKIEENERVVEYALNKRHVKLVDTGLEIGNEGLTK